MPDILSREQRKRCMSRVKGINTSPELVVRKGLFRRGYRYKLHDKCLPGKPDLVFPKYHAVVFIHGCFWHGHDCPRFTWPETRKKFWRKKILGNIERDKKNEQELKDRGWRVLTVWECTLKGKGRLPVDRTVNLISEWLEKGKRNKEIKGKQIKK